MTALSEKDRYGDQLHDVEKAPEDQWAAARDRELLAELLRRADERVPLKRSSDPATKVFTRILCPIDTREGSFAALDFAALDFAARLAAQNGAELYLLNVCSTVTAPLGGPVTDRAGGEQSARRELEQLAAERLSQIEFQVLVTTGDAVERVTSVQSALAADLIVMGTHGRRGVPHFFLGSVTERVVREADYPVLAICPDSTHLDEIVG
jgi:nucleotide-binding universal stress UspA family protein